MDTTTEEKDMPEKEPEEVTIIGESLVADFKLGNTVNILKMD